MSDISVKEKLAKDIETSVHNIRKKYKLLRADEADHEEYTSKTLKPLIDPILNLENKLKKQQITNVETCETQKTIASEHKSPQTPNNKKHSELKSFSDYINFVKRQKSMWDQTFGINVMGNKFIIGDVQINVQDDVIKVGDLKYKLTTGLLELLFLKNPNLLVVKKDDKVMYKSILMKTIPDKLLNSSQNKSRNSRSIKYNKIIKRLMEESTMKTFGSGMSTHSPVFEYYNNPNELVNRLRLLIASTHAGHNNHNNEITSLVEELREEGVIL